LESLFDAIQQIDFDEFDRFLIVRFKGFEKGVVEIMKCSTSVKATGNVEDWLRKLQGEMQKTVRN